MKTLSEDSKYYIPKHRYLELKHFCLQYNDWNEETLVLLKEVPSNLMYEAHHFNRGIGYTPSDPTFQKALRLAEIDAKIDLIRKACKETDEDLHTYLLIGVTSDKNYEFLNHVLRMPCSRGTYYDRYRKFFYILDKMQRNLALTIPN